MRCIKLCEGDVLKLTNLIITEFESYKDEPIYEGETEELEYESKEDIEIRSCSIYSMEQLITETKKVCGDFIKNIEKDINYTIIIDNFLSDYRHAHDQLLMETQPFPNIKCVYY